MRLAGVVAAVVLLSSCSTSDVASSSPSPASRAPISPLPAPSPLASPPSPSPTPTPNTLVFPSPSPLPIGTALARQALAPGKVLPIAALCSYKLLATADGNVIPTFCRAGAINALAWRWYVPVSPNVMSLGPGATSQAVTAAMCGDGKNYHATLVEEQYAYELSATYYGWKFATEPSCR